MSCKKQEASTWNNKKCCFIGERVLYEKIQKWIKQYRGAAVLLGFGVLTLIIYGSFAAYISFNSVKRVVSTGTQSDTMFGSNYLSPLNFTPCQCKLAYSYTL